MPNFKYFFDNTNMLEFSTVDKQVYTEMNWSICFVVVKWKKIIRSTLDSYVSELSFLCFGLFIVQKNPVGYINRYIWLL